MKQSKKIEDMSIRELLEYYAQQLEEQEKRQTLLPKKTEPDYSNMTLREELEARFALMEQQEQKNNSNLFELPLQKPQAISFNLNTLEKPKEETRSPFQKPLQNSKSAIDLEQSLRTAEQITTGVLDGLSLGFIDEINGLTTATGYAIGSLNPYWNKNNESFWNAAKRGYITGRDNRRQILQEGLNEHPSLVGSAQFIGSVLSPINHTNIMGNLPVLNHVGKTMQNPMINGGLNGFGSAEGNWQEQGINTIMGMANGAVSNFAATPVSSKLYYTPKGYNGNLIHNLAQSTMYNLTTENVNDIINTANNNKYK